MAIFSPSIKADIGTNWAKIMTILDSKKPRFLAGSKFPLPLAASMVAAPILAADAPQAYQIDSSASNAKAKVAFFGLASKTARFPKISGSAKIDPKKLSSLSLNVNIDARALTAGDGVTLRRLKGEKFFHVAKYPSIRFSGSKLRMSGVRKGTLSGQLTARGVTRPVTLAVTFSQPISAIGGKNSVALVATTKINRRDFGMTAYSAIVGKTVKITVNTRLKAR